MLFDINPLLLTLIISLVIQAIFFAFAVTLKTDKVTDLSYGLTFVFIAVFWALQNTNAIGVVETTLVIMTGLWGARIASYLLVRIIKTGTDKRFDDKRDDPIKFGMFWLLQGVSVWLIMIPTVYMLTRAQSAGVDVWTVIGVGVWAAGLIIETIADLQLYKFRFLSDNEGRWIETGLWKFSRHPNYYGEILVWWGVFIVGVGIYQGASWLVVIGPIAITVLLRYISGVPLLEKSSDERWGADKDYVAYKKSTNLIVLGPRKTKS